MGRAPASAVAYLILYKKVSMYKDPRKVVEWVRGYRKVVTPNINAITNAINSDAFKYEQSKQKDDFVDLMDEL